MRSVAGALEKQGGLLAKLTAEQAEIKNALMEESEDRRVQELRMRMEQSDEKELEIDIVDEMNKRFKEFESIFNGGRTSSSAVKVRAPESGEKEAEPGAGSPAGSRAAVGPANAVEDIIKKLKPKAMKPQELFMRALEEYSPTDPEQWSTHYPPGYRERLAPGWLGEVYSTGVTLKEWAKNWLRERKMGESKDAREILPAMVALDSIFLRDQARGAINFASVERLARKAYGIVAG